MTLGCMNTKKKNYIFEQMVNLITIKLSNLHILNW